MCWDTEGKFLASLSEDSVRVWAVGSGGDGGECVHELSCNGNKFQSCVFHPSYSSLLVIGCYQVRSNHLFPCTIYIISFPHFQFSFVFQSLEVWNVTENKTLSEVAHEGLIAGLAASNANGLVASASHDRWVKLWK